MATPSIPQFPRTSSSRAGLLLVEGHQHLAVAGQPLADSPAEVPRNQRPAGVPDTAPPRGVVERLERAPEPAPVEDVPVALGGQEGDLGELAGDHGIQPGRGGQVEHGGVADPDLGRPSRTEVSLWWGSVGTFTATTRPPSTAITSVKVPPTSTPMSMLLTGRPRATRSSPAGSRPPGGRGQTGLALDHLRPALGPEHRVACSSPRRTRHRCRRPGPSPVRSRPRPWTRRQLRRSS